MTARLPLFAIPALLLLLPLLRPAPPETEPGAVAPISKGLAGDRPIPATPGPEPAAEPAAEASPAAAAAQEWKVPGGVRLRNASKEAVRAELGIAVRGRCDGSHVVLGERTVPPGRTWSIRSSQPLCIRWEKEPPGGGERRMGEWEQKATAAGQVVEVVL